MSKIISIVHIYRHAEFVFVVPLVQIARGPWQETFPVHQVNRQNVTELILALEKTQQNEKKVVDSAPNAWNMEVGEFLREASALCTIRWYEDGLIKIIPQSLHIYKNESNENIERGWHDDREVIEAVSSKPLSYVAEKVFELSLV